jgi:thioesterase domain-containing protein
VTRPQRMSTDEATATIWAGILGVARHLGKREPIPVERRPVVVQLKKGTAETSVYFIGAALGEYHLAQLICSQLSIFGVEVPWPSAWRIAAMKKDTSALPTMEQLVAQHVAAISVHTRSSPCVLAGISFAGLMAFEAAHQLNEKGGKVEMVILLDAQAKYPAPHEVAWQKLQNDWKPELSQRSTDRASQTIASRLGGSWSILQWMLANEMKRLGRRILQTTTGDLGPLTPRFDDLGVPLHWALVERLYSNALKTYRLRCLDCHGALFRADPRTEGPARALDGSLGWGKLFSRGLEIIEVIGDHGTMLEKPHSLVLAGAMSELMNRS